MTECPASGKWVWNENYNHLEFCSNVQHDDEKQQRDTKKNVPITGSSALRDRPLRVLTRQEIKLNKHHTTVTLLDVKQVAKFMLGEVEQVGQEFEIMFRTQQLDDLLYLLLNYFEFFFEKRDILSKPSPIHIEDSPETKRFLLDIRMRMEATRKQLGRAYAILIMGIGMCEMHHMKCGKSRVSNTYKDRSIYETFYSFCSMVVWITFRRRDFEVIRIESNRVLRSNAFNPALRQKVAREWKEFSTDENGRPSEAARNAGTAFYRRAFGKRPSKKEMENMRSTAMSSIIPLPKEDSDYLFTMKGKFPEKQLGEGPRRDEMTLEEQLDEVLNFSKLSVLKNIGILGEPLKLFNLMTLSALADETKEELLEEEEDVPAGNQLVPGEVPSLGSQSVTTIASELVSTDTNSQAVTEMRESTHSRKTPP